MGIRRRLDNQTERNVWRPDRVNHRGSDDAGFTLIELLIVMIVTPLLVGALSLSLVAMFQLQSSASDRLGATSSSQVIGAIFYQDVQSATQFTTFASPMDPPPCGTGTQVLAFQWAASGTNELVTYSWSPSGATSPFGLLEYQFTRNQCAQNLSTSAWTLVGSENLSATVFNNLSVSALSSAGINLGPWQYQWWPTTSIQNISLTVNVEAMNRVGVDTNSTCSHGIAFCFTLNATPRDWSSATSGSNPVSQVGGIIPAQFNGNSDTDIKACNSNNPDMIVNGTMVINSDGSQGPTVTGNKQNIYASPVNYYAPGGAPSQIGNGVVPQPISTQVTDPLQDLPAPSLSGLPIYPTLASATANVVTVGGTTYTYVLPGIYNFNLVDPNGSQLILMSGTFILNNGVSGAITSGVGGDFIYEAGGLFSPVSSNVWPMSTGTYADLSVWVASPGTIAMGSGNQSLNGVVYVRGGQFSWFGTPDIWIGDLDAASAGCSGGGNGQTNIGFTQSIAFSSPAPAEVTMGGTPYNVIVNSPPGTNSGNPITVFLDPLSTSGSCSIGPVSSTSTTASTTVTFVGQGECIIDASQSPSGQTSSPVAGGYGYAPTVQQIIQVGP